MFFILDENKKVVDETNALVWAQWRNKSSNTRIGNDTVGEIRISTIFLGVGHVLFETCVFGGEWDQTVTRYESYENAVKGHALWVDRIKNEELH